MDPGIGLSRIKTESDTDDERDVQWLSGSDTSLQAAAIDRLYQQHATHLAETARGLLGGSGESFDVVQEVFVRAWQQADQYDSTRGTVGAWLVSMARSRALDMLRARQAKKRQPSVDVTSVTTVAPSDRIPPNYEILHAAVMLLPDPQRRLVDLSFFDGLSHSEIASRTGLALGTVKTRLRMTLQALRLAVPRDAMDALASLRRPIATWLEHRVLGHRADIYLVDRVHEGRVQRIEWGHVDPAVHDVLSQVWRFVPPASVASHPVRRVMQSCRPELVHDTSSSSLSEIAASVEHLELMQRLGVRSIISQPIFGRDRLVGALTLVRVAASGKLYDEADMLDTAPVAAALEGLG